MLTVLFLAVISLARPSKSDIVKPQICYKLDYGCLLVEIEAPAIAWPSDMINITVRVNASAKIHIDFIKVNFSCLRGNLEKVPLLSATTTLESVDLDGDH